MNYLPSQIPFYTYKITLVPTSQFYFGSRYIHVKYNRSPEDDLWKYYFSSSKVVKLLIEKFGKGSFLYEIIDQSIEKDFIFRKEQDLIKNNFQNTLLLNKRYYDYENNKKVFSSVGLLSWINLSTGELRRQMESPGIEWCRGNHSSGRKMYQNVVTNERRWFKDLPTQDWKVTSSIMGKHRWVNIETSDIKYSVTSPGEKWERFGASSGKRMWKNKITGNILWNTESPGTDWIPYSTAQNKRHYKNIITGEVRLFEYNPGYDWLKYNPNKGRTKWIKDGKIKFSFECPGDGWIMSKVLHAK